MHSSGARADRYPGEKKISRFTGWAAATSKLTGGEDVVP